MKFFPLRIIAACALLSFAVVGPARADVTLVMHGTLNAPGVQSSPQIQAMLAQYLNSTQYISGNHIRTDAGPLTVLVDTSTHKGAFLNNTAKTYREMDMTPDMVAQMMTGGMGIPPGTSYKVEDTGKTTTLLNHKVRHFIASASIPMGQLGTMTIHQDILAAQDLDAADTAAVNSMNALMPSETHVQGVPLATTTTITGGPMGTMTIKQEATAISTSAIPANEFQIPSDYSQTQQPMMPGMGGAAPTPPAQ